MWFGMVSAVEERNMRGTLGEDGREPWSELKVRDLLSVLAFGASFEEIANFLIDNVAEREIVFIPCAARLTDLRARGRCRQKTAVPGEDQRWLYRKFGEFLMNTRGTDGSGMIA
jgi:hypothetical protein